MVTAAYWLPAEGVTEAVRITTYVGDGTNSREIDLGDDYQEVLVQRMGGANPAGQAWATLTAYGLQAGSNSYIGTFSDIVFQGKMSGVDANKIKLGTQGPNTQGVNEVGVTYQVTAKKYSTVLS